MRRVTDHIRDRLLARVHTDAPGQATETLDALRQSQWCPTFETLMRNRLLMGRYRYGALHRQQPNGYDNIGSAIARLRLYQQTGNAEHLVDAANLCLVEFVTGDHHFEATDDGIHTLLLDTSDKHV